MAASSRIEFSLWELMFVGENLASLLAARSRKVVGPTRSDHIGVIERLRLLQADLEGLELTESEATLSQKVEDLIAQLGNPDRQSKHLGSQAAEVRVLAQEVSEKLQKEASARSTFVVQRSREGKVEALLRDPVAYFGLTLDGPLKLSDVGLSDFREAGRCYAVGFTAAAIMFMVRATEDVLRSYYCIVTHQPTSGTMGHLISILEKPTHKCPKDLTDKLRYNILPKRNAAMHPDPREIGEWDEDAAERVLTECREAIQMMTADALARLPGERAIA